VYGAGNIGQSLAAFGSPVLAAAVGYAWGFWAFSVLTTIWLVVFLCRRVERSDRLLRLGFGVARALRTGLSAAGGTRTRSSGHSKDGRKPSMKRFWVPCISHGKTALS